LTFSGAGRGYNPGTNGLWISISNHYCAVLKMCDKLLSLIIIVTLFESESALFESESARTFYIQITLLLYVVHNNKFKRILRYAIALARGVTFTL